MFMVLPLLGIAYISWHLWTLLPLSTVWRLLVLVLLFGSFLLLFLNFGRRFDSLPLPLAQVCYEVATSSIFVMMYLVITFLMLDLGPARGKYNEHLAPVAVPEEDYEAENPNLKPYHYNDNPDD